MICKKCENTHSEGESCPPGLKDIMMDLIQDTICNNMMNEDELRDRVLELEDFIETLNKEIETLNLKLAACGVAAMCNTEESVATQRINKDNPFWSASYGDVCGAVDREMAYRDTLNKIENLCKHSLK